MVGAAEENAYPRIVDLSHKRCRNRDLGVVNYDDPDIGKRDFIENPVLMALFDNETSILDAKVLWGADRDRQ